MALPKRTDEETLKLWDLYKKHPSDELRNDLMERYLPLVRYIAERISIKLPKNVDVDDLSSAGIFGLMDAINGFDPARGVKFETYCTTRIRGAILDELRSLDWVPRLVRSKANQLEKAIREMEADLGRPPEDHELAEKLGLTLEEFADLEREASAASMVSMNKSWGSDDGDDSDLPRTDIIHDKKMPDPSEKLQSDEIKKIITQGLSETEKMIVTLYYFEELTMKEIGVILSLSESRVCQIHSKIIVRLSVQFRNYREEMTR
jgi:RNA polymerase sigma factor for flagellar operon FliA